MSYIQILNTLLKNGDITPLESFVILVGMSFIRLPLRTFRQEIKLEISEAVELYKVKEFNVRGENILFGLKGILDAEFFRHSHNAH